MKAVAVRELKNRLSAYLREVARGEVVLVTTAAGSWPNRGARPARQVYDSFLRGNGTIALPGTARH
jgi:hypothetical protein